MQPYAPTPAEIDAFVKRVTDWTDAIQSSADAVLRQIKSDYQQGKNGVTYAMYSAALDGNLAVTKSCADIMNAASAVLLSVAESQLAPIAAASQQLADAAKRITTIKNAAKVGAAVAGAAGAVALAFAAPSVASIAGAAAALGTAAHEIRTDPDP